MSVKENPLTGRQRSGSKISETLSETMALIVAERAQRGWLGLGRDR
jgi:hypothetical protein